jgi:lipopolysaccharide assembly protein A
MQFVRTLIWVLILAALLIFTAFNWRPVEVQIWTNLVLETKIPALVIVAFLLGLVPTWLFYRGTRWRLNRRISHLESAARNNVAARPADAVAPPAPATKTEPIP